MRRLFTIVSTVALVGALALPAFAPTGKFSFNDVTLPDGRIGEIEAG